MEDHGWNEVWVLFKPRCRVVQVGDVAPQSDVRTKVDLLDLSSWNQQHPKAGHGNKTWRGSNGPKQNKFRQNKQLSDSTRQNVKNSGWLLSEWI